MVIGLPRYCTLITISRSTIIYYCFLFSFQSCACVLIVSNFSFRTCKVLSNLAPRLTSIVYRTIIIAPCKVFSPKLQLLQMYKYPEVCNRATITSPRRIETISSLSMCFRDFIQDIGQHQARLIKVTPSPIPYSFVEQIPLLLSNYVGIARSRNKPKRISTRWIGYFNANAAFRQINLRTCFLVFYL